MFFHIYEFTHYLLTHLLCSSCKNIHVPEILRNIPKEETSKAALLSSVAEATNNKELLPGDVSDITEILLNLTSELLDITEVGNQTQMLEEKKVF